MMNGRSIRVVVCLCLIGVVVGYGGPAEAKKKSSGADQLIKRVEEDLKGYEQKLKAAQERMKLANSEGEEVEPLIEPAEAEMVRWQEAMDAQQGKRAAASREMQAKIQADPKIESVRVAEEKAEDRRDGLAAELMPKIESADGYQELAKKRDASAKWLDKCKQEKRDEDVPYAATAFARDQGALSTFVQDQLASVPAYKAAADAVSQAQSDRRATERAVAERWRAESGLETIDAVYKEQQGAYREAREKLRELERRFKGLRSAYEDAEKDADWAARRIEIAKNRIETLKRKK